MKMLRRYWGLICLGLGLWLSWSLWATAALPPLPASSRPLGDTSLEGAFQTAIATARLAQQANSADAWNQVAIGWSQAVQQLQEVPVNSPQRIFAQRKSREYLANLAIAQQRAETVQPPRVFPALGSQVLDEQLGVYLSYVATFGPPDVLVMGSSRALQGLDPQVLQQGLNTRGLPNVRGYTFGVNGGTAQIVSFVLRQLLSPDQLPRMVVWADGSRAFNSGRVDRTFASILNSPGYAALQTGDRPSLSWGEGDETVESKAVPLPTSAINGYGFLPVTDIFDPNTYYQRFARVSGEYDSSYRPFDLEGVQTSSLRAIASFAKSRNIGLVFVNLPLSSDYLDETRLSYERQFQAYLRRESQLGEFIVVDLLEQWQGQNQFFADPSHLNQNGAVRLAQQLAAHSTIPWDRLAGEASSPSRSRLRQRNLPVAVAQSVFPAIAAE